MPPKAAKIWFITGASKGFGSVWANAALERGDKVAATSRRGSSLNGLVERYGDNVLPIQLDVTDKAAVDAAVETAHDQLGGLDIVVNNAGYGLFGTTEELSEDQAREMIDVNLLGPLWVTKAALPYLRKQRSGHFIQVSSAGGVMTVPTLGLYNASKWGVEAFSQALADEVREFGIHVTIVEPGGYDTDWLPKAVCAERQDAYANVWVTMDAVMESVCANLGDPAATGPALLELVDAERPPLRIFFGVGPLAGVRAEYARRLAEWEEWNELSERAHAIT
jgi:NAD(P)-dependent dehydrogenase (short-subunit alcohol dehydrogenase family)